MSVAVVVLLAAWPWVGGEAYPDGAVRTGGDSTGKGVDAVYEVVADVAPIGPLPEAASQIVEAQPPGSSTALVEHFWGFRSPGGSPMDNSARVVQADWDSPLVADTVRLLEGRMPGPGEVVISPRIAAGGHLGVGDTMELSDPDASLQVVGIGSQGSGNPAEMITAHGEFLAIGSAGSDDSSASLARVIVLTDIPDGEVAPEVLVRDPGSPAQQVQYPITYDELDMAGPRWQIEPSALVVMAVALGMAVALTSGAAFGIGAARRRRAAGLLAVNGGDDAAMRIAAVTEALVVAIPAAVLGVVLPLVVSKVWIELRAPRWDLVAALRFNPWIVVPSCVFVVAAALLGTLLFTRSLRRSSIPALLDQRTWRANRSGRPVGPRGLAPSIIGVGLLVLLVFAGMWSRTVGGMVPAFSEAFVVAVVVGSFVLLVWLVMSISRRLLARRVSGRIVMRDVMRRPAGAAAAAVVVAIWSALMIGSAAQSRYASVGTTESTTSYWIIHDSGDANTGRGVVPTPSTSEVPSLDHDVSDANAGQPVGGLTVWPGGEPAVVQRGTDPRPRMPIGDLADRLARAGLPTVRAQIGQWAGPCAVCPEGYIPTVAVLSSTDGAGLSSGVNRLLTEGHVVTPMPIDIPPGTELEGMPITIAPVDVPGAEAVLLASEAPEGVALTNPSGVLVGSTGELDAVARNAVAAVLLDAGATVNSNDLELDLMVNSPAATRSLGSVDPMPLRIWALWLLPLLLVTLAATTAHRREHGEAAVVLDVLGAGSRTARRLASRTAALIAGLGVTVGVGVGLIGVIAAVTGSRDASLTDVLWSVEFLGACALVGVVPVVVGMVAWVLPPARQPGTGAMAPA
jgi:putative ABC transport system permease protein